MDSFTALVPVSPVAMGLSEGAVGANAEYQASGHTSKSVFLSVSTLQWIPLLQTR